MAIATAFQAAMNLGTAAHNAGSFFDVFSPLQRTGGYWSNANWPNLAPTVDQALNALMRGYITPERCRAILRMNGVPGVVPTVGANDLNSDADRQLIEDWTGVYRSSFQVPAPGELLTLLNRGFITEFFARQLLRNNGFAEPQMQDLILKLKDELPGPSDLVMFALKEAWDRDVVRAYGYDDDFPVEFDYWMAKQGYSGDANIPAMVGPAEPPVSWAQLYWRVHWQNLAPTQAYEMFQRLRPNRLARFIDTIPGVQAFTLDDLKRVLKINDYAPAWRDRLAAISYRTPMAREMQRMYALGIIDDAELFELNRDVGYSPTDARARTRLMRMTVQKQRHDSLRIKAKAQILDAYQLGVLSKDVASKNLYELSIAGTAAADRYNQLPPAAQQAEANNDPDVQGALNDRDATISIQTAKEQLAVTRKRFLNGFLTDMQADAVLQNAGFTITRRAEYIGRWKNQLGGGTVHFSAAKLQRFYRRGIIGYGDAFQALLNLQFTPAQAALTLADTQFDIALDQARADAKAAKDAASQQKALEQAAKAAAKMHEQQIAALVKQASKGDLKRYFTRGIIGIGQLRASLIARGMVSPGLDQMIADAQVSRQEYLDKLAKARAAAAKQKGASGGQSNPNPAANGKTSPAGAQ